MLEFAYYPGCSLETSGSSYDKSIRQVFQKLGIGLKEIEDWNCCGATMYMSVKALVGYSISARNLAIAESMGLPICAPCSSCYTILRKTNRFIESDTREREHINDALGAAGLKYTGTVPVRHPLDILVNDVGIEKIAAAARVKLTGIKVAPYYGCQVVRPQGFFDDVDEPMTMDRLFKGLGAEVTHFPGKVRCCGGMLMTTQTDIAYKLNHSLLQAAVDNGAEIIATACPLCQMNLEAYQAKINQVYGTSFNIPVVYFSHLVGIALGIPAKDMGMEDFVIPADRLTAKLAEVSK
jgi:heterodisulfide reductase subunit B